MLSAEQGSPELSIDFGIAGNSGLFRRFGWAHPETHHTWTLGWLSGLELPRPTVPGTYVMLVQLDPFVWATLAGQRLCVLVNDTEVGRFVVRGFGALEWIVPWSLLAGGERVSVVFCHPDAAKPCEVIGVPDSREIAFAFHRLGLFRQHEPLEMPLGSASDTAETGEGLSLAELMMQFESLGQNCEFGLVQRRCGAEPLGLLRFASSPLPALLAGLAARFEGLGDPGQLEIQLAKDEYLVIDQRFGLLYHPWIKFGEAEPEEIRRREERRLPFLRRKLIEDLEEGRKIFVYHGMESVSRSVMLHLLLTLRAYGPATLLWVELQDDAHPPGTVEWAATGLLKGYVDRFAPAENAHDLSLDCWLAVCRNAYRLVQLTGR